MRKAADAAIFLAFCSWLLIALLGLLLVKPYFVWQSGGDERLIQYGVSYLSVCMLSSVGQMGQWVFDRFVIASGRSGLFLLTLSAASVTNLILDPIFIFGLLGLPRMETFGAALATVIGQMVGMLAGIVVNRKMNREIPFGLTLRPDGRSILEIQKVGIPSALVQVLTSFVGILMNSILIAFSNTAVAVYGICNRVSGIALVGVHGIDNGVIPIVAYNYGAANKKLVPGAEKPLQPRRHDKRRNADQPRQCHGAQGWNSDCHHVIRGIKNPQHTDRGKFQHYQKCQIKQHAIQHSPLHRIRNRLSLGMSSMVVTMLRQAALPLVFAWMISKAGKIDLLWYGFVLAELIGIPLAIRFWRKGYRQNVLQSDPGL